jgi:hypothetical protein
MIIFLLYPTGCWHTDHHQSQSNSRTPGHFGDYLCDSPWSLLESASQAMKDKQGDNVEFVLWTGWVDCFWFKIDPEHDSIHAWKYCLLTENFIQLDSLFPVVEYIFFKLFREPSYTHLLALLCSHEILIAPINVVIHAC